jgi:hypothetical protein
MSDTPASVVAAHVEVLINIPKSVHGTDAIGGHIALSIETVVFRVCRRRLRTDAIAPEIYQDDSVLGRQRRGDQVVDQVCLRVAMEEEERWAGAGFEGEDCSGRR